MNSFTLTDKLKTIVNQFPDRVALQIKRGDSYRRCNYKELYETSQIIAGSLINLGIKKGDRAAIVLENMPEWGFIYFGIILAGAIAVPIDCESSPGDLAYILGDSETKLVFTANNLLPEFKEAIHQVSSLKRIVAIKAQKPSKTIISFSSLIADRLKAKVPRPKILPGDLASIVYTSGTTSKPKGVMLTQSNFYSNFESIRKLGMVSEKDNLLSILPLHHSYPFMITLIVPLLLGAKVTYPPGLKKVELFNCLKETKVTILIGVPQIFYMFYKQIKEAMSKPPFLIRISVSVISELFWLIRKVSGINLSRLVFSKIHRNFGKPMRFFVSGGAKLNPEAAVLLSKLGFTIFEGYGLTETSPAVTFNLSGRRKLGSCGKVIPGVELKIADSDKAGAGEILIKGPNVMVGYYKQGRETKAVLKAGWFYTGDLGCLDKSGYLYIKGRSKELIVLSSGKNISPEEVESHYIKSPFIKELCILAVSEAGSEQLKAVIVPALEHYRKIGAINIQEKINWDLENLSKQLPAYKRIMGFVIVKDDLPKTRLGKIKRYEVQKKFSAELSAVSSNDRKVQVSTKAEDLDLLYSYLGKKVIRILKKQLSINKEISLDDHLELDLGIDSLGRVELATALENNLGVDIADSLIDKVFTVREIITGLKDLAAKEVITGKDSRLAKAQAVGWSELLDRGLAPDIIGKINLSPGSISRFFACLGQAAFCFIFKIFWQLKVFGRENIPKAGAFILCSNHNSFLDGFLIVTAAPKFLRKNLYSLGLRGYFELPLVRNAVSLMKIIPLDPAQRLLEALGACAYVLKREKPICIFPEGGRSADGTVKEFKKGVGILAKELDLPLVPVYIKGSYESWPRGRRFPRLRPVKVIFGQAFGWEVVRNLGLSLGAKDDYEAISLGIREAVVKLS